MGTWPVPDSLIHCNVTDSALQLCGTHRGKKESLLAGARGRTEGHDSVTLHSRGEYFKQRPRESGSYPVHRKQLSTSALVIATGLPLKSANDNYLASSFEELQRYLLLTFKPLITVQGNRKNTAVFHACVGT